MESMSLWSSFLKMIFALMIVLGLMIGVMYFMKNFMQRTGPSSNHTSLINILSSRYLGPKTSIILVEVLDQVIVVGITGQQMTPLMQIDDPLSVAKIKSARNDGPDAPFAGDVMAKLLSRIHFHANGKTKRSSK